MFCALACQPPKLKPIASATATTEDLFDLRYIDRFHSQRAIKAGPRTAPPQFLISLRPQLSENAIMLLPRWKSTCVLPPAPTTMYCLLPTMKLEGGALTPAPARTLHNSLPLDEL